MREFNISPDNSKKIIQGIEVINNDNFAIRLNVPDNVDQIKFEQKLKQEYKKVTEDLKREYPNAYQKSSDELKDNTGILKIIEQLAQLKIIHIENIIKTENNNMSQPNNSTNNITGNQFGVGIINGHEVSNKENDITINNGTSEQKQNLAEAAKEIQALLEQLDKTYSTDSTTDKMIVATEVIKQIENSPSLTARILSALKVGGVKAFEQSISHPAVSFVIGALEDWQKNRGELE